MTTRRERLRAQTLEEIHAEAFRQIDTAGTGALSLNLIAKAIGFSGPAIYRYVASRDELITQLIAAAYADLTDTIAKAAEQDGTLHGVAVAYRQWASDHPRRYTMLFTERGTEQPDSDEAIAVINGAMLVILGLLEHGDSEPRTELDHQLVAWGEKRQLEGDPATLRRGLLTWTRLHGIVAIELTGAFAAMGIDPTLLIASEVDGLSTTG